jgi:hypothetical protein
MPEDPEPEENEETRPTREEHDNLWLRTAEHAAELGH